MRTNLWIWAKRALCLLALAAIIGLMLSACDKEPDQQNTTPVYRAPYEKELQFNNRNVDSVKVPIVQHFARDTACKHIYLTVTYDNNYTSISTEDITKFRTSLGERIAIDSNKISGRGDFWFKKGKASVADSLWFIQHGWTINQYRHY